MRRVPHGVVIGMLLVGVLATGMLAFAVRDWADGPEFTPEKWREARAEDSKGLDLLATDAVESDALIGKTRPELRRILGRPDATWGDRAWEWDIGSINDGIGPGDEGALRVRFDRRTGRSDEAATGASRVSHDFRPSVGRNS